MSKKKSSSEPGFAKLLDAWNPPQDCGAPVGCLATSFTFSPAFFEEECLARFLQIESDPDEDGPVYLVEREEKMSQLMAAIALVDQRHCRGSRSLRWDLLSARLRPGILHSKVSLLCWTNRIRLIIASANLTEDGYRRNQEVFGVIDFHLAGEAPVNFLLCKRRRETVALGGRKVQRPAFGNYSLERGWQLTSRGLFITSTLHRARLSPSSVFVASHHEVGSSGRRLRGCGSGASDDPESLP